MVGIRFSSGTFSVLAGEYDLMSEEGTEQEIQVATVIVVRGNEPRRERSGSVVECLTRDRGAPGSSLTGVTALCPWARTLILA